jgi:hypothetical protein
MFARIKTPEDFLKCHISIVLDLDEMTLGGTCNMKCGGTDPVFWSDCVCRAKPDYRVSGHPWTYGPCFWDDTLSSDCKGMNWLGCSKHANNAAIRGPCEKHKCTEVHTDDEVHWSPYYNRKEDTCGISIDPCGECWSFYMVRGDPAVYAGWNCKKVYDSLPEYLEELSLNRKPERAHEI